MKRLLVVLALMALAAPCVAQRRYPTLGYVTGIIQQGEPATAPVEVTYLGSRTNTAKDTMNLTVYVPEDSSTVVIATACKVGGGGGMWDTYVLGSDETYSRGAFDDSYNTGLVTFNDVAAGAHVVHVTASSGATAFGAMVVASFSSVRDTQYYAPRDARGNDTGTAAATATLADSLVDAHSVLVSALGFVGNDADAAWDGGLTQIASAGVGTVANAAKVQLAYTVVRNRAPVAATATLASSRVWSMVLSAFSVTKTTP